MRFEIVANLPREVALPHGDLQKTEAVHDAFGLFLQRGEVVIHLINQPERRFVPVDFRIKL